MGHCMDNDQNMNANAIHSIRLLAIAAVLLPALAMGGCASYLSAQVTTFHRAEPDFKGRRFAIEPSAAQRDSLEFKTYADLVRQALVSQGLVDAAGAPADVGVTLQYSVSDGKPVIASYPNYGYAPYGPVWALTPYRGPGGVVQYGWAPSYPIGYGVIGERVVQSAVYRRELRVEIADLGSPSKSEGEAKAARLYEGSAISEGGSASLAPVMPAMIRALFVDFPGPNGSSRIVRVPSDPVPVAP